jgi:pyrroloquinoline quinone (PQQ) biosynthesis protein C
MSLMDKLEIETATQRQALQGHPFIQAALAGELTLAGYRAFLVQAWHHVSHTAPIFMTAGARCSGRHAWLRPSLAEYTSEEIGHDDWILNDLKALGGDGATEVEGAAGLPVELMVAFTYDVAQRRNPIGVFGMVYCLEGTSIKVATEAAAAIGTALQLPASAFSYLSSHGSLDIDHFQFFEALMNKVTDPDDQDWIIHCAKVVYELYTQMFDGLLQPAGLQRGGQ